jgi:signal transduction histidine kinase
MSMWVLNLPHLNHAMPHGGKISSQCGKKEDKIIIEIKDDGIGIKTK